jgi:hypothetical protein
MGDIYHRHCEERSDDEVGTTAGYTLGVVPAKAGTHNPREEFGEDSLFGTMSIRNERSRGMGPGVRRDDSCAT